MDGTWSQLEEEPQRAERMAVARQRRQSRQQHAEGADVAPAPNGGEIWVRTDSGAGDSGTAESLTLWVLHDAAHTHLMDVHGTGIAPAQAWHEIRALARAQGWRSLAFSAFRDDDFAAGLAEASQARRIATKMQRATADAPMPQGITTVPMTEMEYAGYAARCDRGYAEELLASGAAADMSAALAEAAESMSRLLPDGLQTPDQQLWTVRDPADDVVGVLWVHQQAERAFIYDIEMQESVRGRGYGTQALRAAAAHARAAGRPLIALNVFGHNADARRLYLREGYIATEVIWAAQAGD